MQESKIHSFRSHIRDHFILEWKSTLKRVIQSMGVNRGACLKGGHNIKMPPPPPRFLGWIIHWNVDPFFSCELSGAVEVGDVKIYLYLVTCASFDAGGGPILKKKQKNNNTCVSTRWSGSDWRPWFKPLLWDGFHYLERGCHFCFCVDFHSYYTAASCVLIPTPNELYTALCLYLCLPLIRCINFFVYFILYSLYSIYILFSIVILQNAENK